MGLAAAFPDRTRRVGRRRRAWPTSSPRRCAAPDGAGRAAGVHASARVTTADAGDLETVVGHPARARRAPDRRARPPRRPAASPSSRPPPRCSSSPACSRRASCARRSCSSRPPARRPASPARARGRRRAPAAPVDAVIVLGDMAGTRVAQAVGGRLAAVVAARRRSALERTVQAAVRREARSDAGGPRALGQWVRRALPVTVSEQGPIGAAGLPAVLLSESGELGPAPRRAGDSRRACGAFGRAGAARRRRDRRRRPRATSRPSPTRPDGIVTLRNVLPDWARAAGRRLAAAARAAGRARRVLPRAPPPRADRARGCAGWPSPRCRCRSPGCGCACSAPTGALDAPDGPVLPRRLSRSRRAGSSRSSRR